MTAWVKLELDVASIPKTVFAPPTLPPGFQILPLNELGDSLGQRCRIYELNRTVSADIPDRGEFFTFEEYLAQRFKSDGYRADGQLLLFDGDNLIGLCALSWQPAHPWAFIEMTGVLREYRRRGFGRALKIAAIQRAHTWGVESIRTIHHPNNLAIIESNRSLGFIDATFA